jgi:hypothetical protein
MKSDSFLDNKEDSYVQQQQTNSNYHMNDKNPP